MIAPACVLCLALAPATAAGDARAPVAAHAGSKTSAPAAPPDVYFLDGGDRVSGRTLSKGRRAFVVQTPYGRLTLPRRKLVRILWGDGREEVLQPEAVATPKPPAPAVLVLAVTGRSFWYAWDRREAVDATLRLRLWLDEQELATYTDATLDPEDLPGATVNSFRFDPAVMRVALAEGVASAPPDTRPGRATLRLELPAAPGEPAPRPRRLRVAYQINEGTRDEPAWRDVAGAALDVLLEAGASEIVEVAQDSGRMEFSGFGRKRMKNVQSFRLEVSGARGTLDSLPPPP